MGWQHCKKKVHVVFFVVHYFIKTCAHVPILVCFSTKLTSRSGLAMAQTKTGALVTTIRNRMTPASNWQCHQDCTTQCPPRTIKLQRPPKNNSKYAQQQGQTTGGMARMSVAVAAGAGEMRRFVGQQWQGYIGVLAVKPNVGRHRSENMQGCGDGEHTWHNSNK